MKNPILEQLYIHLPILDEDYRGIYKISNIINNRIYIGKSENIANRWKTHIRELVRHSHITGDLQHDYDLYGITAFKFEILEVVPEFTPLEYIEYLYMFDFEEQGYDLYNTVNTKDTIKFKIMERFLNKNLNFAYQHRFPDCCMTNPLAFDFVIFDKQTNCVKKVILLKPRQFTYANRQDLVDKFNKSFEIKIEYCKNNNIKCNVIHYDPFTEENIQLEKLEL